MIIFEDKIHQIYSLKNGIILEVNKIHGLSAIIEQVVMQFALRNCDDGRAPFAQQQIFTFEPILERSIVYTKTIAFMSHF